MKKKDAEAGRGFLKVRFVELSPGVWRIETKHPNAGVQTVMQKVAGRGKTEVMISRSFPSRDAAREYAQAARLLPRRCMLMSGMPETVVDVSESTEWMNLFEIGSVVDWHGVDIRVTPEVAVQMTRRFLRDNSMYADWVITELAGKDLACTCPLDQPCHADVLLEVANGF